MSRYHHSKLFSLPSVLNKVVKEIINSRGMALTIALHKEVLLYPVRLCLKFSMS